jgi:hypothetical protein
MGQLESLIKLNIAELNNKRKRKKKKKKKKESMPLLFILIGLSVNLEILRHCTLKLFGSFIVLC